MDLIQNMAFYVPFALLAEQPYPIFHLKKAPTSSYLWGSAFRFYLFWRPDSN